MEQEESPHIGAGSHDSWSYFCSSLRVSLFLSLRVSVSASLQLEASVSRVSIISNFFWGIHDIWNEAINDIYDHHS